MSIKFLPIQQNKPQNIFFLSPFAVISHWLCTPVWLPEERWPQNLGTAAGCTELQLSEPKMSVLLCFLLRIELLERRFWVKWCLQTNPRQHHIAPVLMKRMQANSLFAIKNYIFFKKLMSWKIKGRGHCFVLKEHRKNLMKCVNLNWFSQTKGWRISGGQLGEISLKTRY